MARIDKVTIDKVLDAADIVDVISDFVSLKKRGSSYLGLCPFHNDRSPSFSVSAARGIFKCFSCGKSGSTVSFLMDLEGMSYTEAIKWLGKKYNIEVKERELTSVEKQAEESREAMFAVNEYALNHFEKTLVDTDEGRTVGLSYFRERGINDAMIKRFHLGYSLDKPDDLLTKAHNAGYEEKYLVETGLCIRTDNGRVYDRFKGRVIYPVHSLSGRVVAFGGRTLRKEKTIAKYVNSPESVIYSKSRELYGMYQARPAIVRKKWCILVEGYMDVISMHQAGVENVVASSGTSLTDGQIRMIKRFADKVTLIYDSDPAGIKASLRGINMLIAAGLSLKVVLLPEGDDPDSFAQNNSSSEVEKYIAEHEQDLIGFKVDILMKDAASDPRKRTEAINDILQTIALIPDVVEQSLYIDECARKVGVTPEILGAQLKKFIAKNREAEYIRKQREQAEQSIGEQKDVPADVEEQPVIEPQNITVVPRQPENVVPHNVYIAEEDIIRYVLRYGMLFFCDIVSDDNPAETRPMSVLDYVECELKTDGITFAYSPFRTLLEAAVAMRDSEWQIYRDEHVSKLLELREKILAEGREELQKSAKDVSDIIAKEKELEQKADEEYNDAFDRIASAFIRDRLLRSEDKDTTVLVASLVSDNVVLSKMHPQVDIHKELVEKLPIAVNNLRNAIVKNKIDQLLEQLARVPKEQTETATAILEQILELKNLSMMYDRFNGESVITPKA